MTIPTIGRIVHYVSYGTPGGEYGKECRAAIVTAVPDEQKPDGTFVQLCVLNPSGLFFNSAHEDQAGHAGGTWHWPERVEHIGSGSAGNESVPGLPTGAQIAPGMQTEPFEPAHSAPDGSTQIVGP